MGLWEERVDVSRGAPEAILKPLLELWSESAPWREDPEVDPFPDCDSEPVFSWN